MNAINRIREILGEHAPAHLEHATETPDGVTIPVTVGKSRSNWDRFYEERNLSAALAPLADRGWTIKAGPKNFRTGTYNELIAQPPAESGTDTATLALRDRIRVEARLKRKTLGDVVDSLEINEDTGTVSFNTAGLPRFEARQIEDLAYALRDAGWTGPIGRRFGQGGLYGTLTAPATGLEVPQARVDTYTAA